ncbi:MAG TPA: hypothetical protein VFZ93_10500 [Albitalea sp.]
MSVLGELRVSLEAMGHEQLAFLFAFVSTYPLAIGGLLEARGRCWAGSIAAAALLGFILATDPWVHGVLLTLFALGAMGVFIAAVCVLDRLPRLLARSSRVPLAVPADVLVALRDRDRDGARPRALPLTGQAGTS